MADYLRSKLMFLLDTSKSKSTKVPKIIRAVKEAVPTEVEELCKDVYRISQDFCPVDKGDLKASGEVTITNNGQRGEVGYGTNHNFHVEFGTYKMAANPFLRKAVAVAKAKNPERMNRISTAIRRG